MTHVACVWYSFFVWRFYVKVYFIDKDTALRGEMGSTYELCGSDMFYVSPTNLIPILTTPCSDSQTIQLHLLLLLSHVDEENWIACTYTTGSARKYWNIKKKKKEKKKTRASVCTISSTLARTQNLVAFLHPWKKICHAYKYKLNRTKPVQYRNSNNTDSGYIH